MLELKKVKKEIQETKRKHFLEVSSEVPARVVKVKIAQKWNDLIIIKSSIDVLTDSPFDSDYATYLL